MSRPGVAGGSNFREGTMAGKGSGHDFRGRCSSLRAITAGEGTIGSIAGKTGGSSLERRSIASNSTWAALSCP